MTEPTEPSNPFARWWRLVLVRHAGPECFGAPGVLVVDSDPFGRDVDDVLSEARWTREGLPTCGHPLPNRLDARTRGRLARALAAGPSADADPLDALVTMRV